MNETTTHPTDEELDSELAALLNDATSEAAAAPATTVNMEQLEAEATAAEMKAEAYEAQRPEDPIVETNAPSVTVEKPSKTRAPRSIVGKDTKPSAALAASMSADELLKAALLTSGDTEDVEHVEALNKSIDSLAKKVGNKAVNLLRFRNEPNKLQSYTRFGLEHLIASGNTDSKTLTILLQSKGYTIGTARSQANQLMSLLPTLRVATRSGKSLTLNADSRLIEAFNAANAA